jgi:hypothetical protein
MYLSRSEIEICTYIGKYRHAVTSKEGQERKQYQRQDSVQLSINGVLTEYAVAKGLNLVFDLNCDYRKFGADLTSRKGKSIDVKSTSNAGGNLNAVLWSTSKPADIFILTEIHYSFVGLIGWIDRDRFLIPAYLKNVGNGEFYSMPQSALLPLDNIVTI